MSPDQRARALRLADGLSSPMGEPGVTGWATMMDAANLLRELAAERVRVPLTDEQLNEVLAEEKVGELPEEYVYLEMEICRAVERAHGITGDAK